MAYKVRQGDSWETLSQQYPDLQQLNPTIRNIKPGMVLQTPFQYVLSGAGAGSGSGVQGYQGGVGFGGGVGFNGGVTNGTVNEPILPNYAPNSNQNGGRGNMPGVRPGFIPTPAPADASGLRYQAQYNAAKGQTADANRWQAQASAYNKLGVGDSSRYVPPQFQNNSTQSTLDSYWKRTTAESEARTAINGGGGKTYTPPAKGRPGYAAYQFYLRQHSKQGQRRRANAFKSASEEALAGDMGGYGQFNWRI